MISLLTAFIFLDYGADWYWWALWLCLLIFQLFFGTLKIIVRRS